MGGLTVATFAALAMLAAVLTHFASPAAAEVQIGAYGGWSHSFASDISINQPGGTNLTLQDVPWETESFQSPPYWGVRGTYWLDSALNWGLMIDYHHAKVIAEQGATVAVTGTRDGLPVGPRDKVGNSFDIMEFTDGLNEIFLGAQYRWLGRRWTPYVGVGVGTAFPHVEFRRGDGFPRTFEYQVTGVAVEGLVGLEYRIGPKLAAFADYKLSYSNNDADLDGGGTLETDILTSQVIFGISYRFGSGLAAAPAPY
jgi:lipid A oxidase